MSVVASNQVEFHPGSIGDFNGRVFYWEGGLYRGVGAGRAEMYRGLFADGTISRLIERKLLVGTEISGLAVEGFELVLSHRAVPVVSYAYEWCAGMLKDAALLTLDLEIELCARGLTLQDAHPWNVLFDGPRPCWVDFGSIVPARGDTLWRAYDEYCHFYLYPLLVMAGGHHRVARRMLADSDDGVLRAEAEALTGQGRARSVLGSVGHKAMALGRRVVPGGIRGMLRNRAADQRAGRDVSAERPEFLRQLREKITGIRVRPPLYSAVHGNGASGQGSMDASRVAAVARALMATRAASVLEVSYESPFYGTLAAKAGARTVAVSVDEAHVEDLYGQARRDGLDVLPLVMDFRAPSPGYGLCGQTSAPATERLGCDLVVALDVTHHLGVRYRLNFDQIARGLATFAAKGVLVDFVEGEHPATRAYWSADFAWYTRENFEAALRRRFGRVEAIAGPPRPTFLCLKEGGR
jgi:hypothetical protein